MTEKEAIDFFEEEVKGLEEQRDGKVGEFAAVLFGEIDGEKRIEVFKIAICALEEIQQYRAIGTVEKIKTQINELKQWHTEHMVKGIKNVFANTSTSICHNCDHKDEYIEELEFEIGKYKAIGTVEDCREAKEKQKPQKPDYEGYGYDNQGNMIYDTWICPCCGERYELDYEDYEHCPKCGQAIADVEQMGGMEE